MIMQHDFLPFSSIVAAMFSAVLQDVPLDHLLPGENTARSNRLSVNQVTP